MVLYKRPHEHNSFYLTGFRYKYLNTSIEINKIQCLKNNVHFPKLFYTSDDTNIRALKNSLENKDHIPKMSLYKRGHEHKNRLRKMHSIFET